MSQLNEIKPPPAPPLPPCLPVQELKLNPQPLLKVDENESDVALERLLLNDLEFNRIFYKINTYCVPQLQDGPKCGLVALSIATSVHETSVSVDRIFDVAVSLRFTNQGEMFSVKSLAYLAEKCCSFKTRIIEGGLSAHLHCILKCLMRKCLLLVPYDADFNHSPCCKKGVKAHWALITGFVITQRKNTKPCGEDSDFALLNSSNCMALCECMDSSPGLSELTLSVHEGKILIGKRPPEGVCDFSEGKVYLIGMQGKSRHVGLWPFDEMADSNNNLVFFSTNRDSGCYVLPEGGLVEGLKGKAVILGYS